MKDTNDIELRSAKTRKLLEEAPSGIVRYGTLAITLILIALLVLAYFILFQ